jgi:hypothetical protein
VISVSSISFLLEGEDAIVGPRQEERLKEQMPVRAEWKDKRTEEARSGCSIR